MEWFSLDAVSWIGVVVAFLVTFAVGALWYSPVAFFPMWKKAAGITDEDMKGANMGAAYAQTVTANLLGVLLLAVLMEGLGVENGGSGAVLGLMVGLVFRGGAHLLHNGFALRSPVVTAIDVAHDTVALTLAGVVLGTF